jgi:hypothetical protein
MNVYLIELVFVKGGSNLQLDVPRRQSNQRSAGDCFEFIKGQSLDAWEVESSIFCILMFLCLRDNFSSTKAHS